MAKTTAPLTPQTAPPQQDLYDDVGSAMMTGATMLSGVPGSGVVGAAGLLLRMQGSMGNQAAQAIAGLRGPGLDALEGYADDQLTGLADACMDVPGLNVAALVASRQMQDGVEFGVGATRFGVDTLGGLVEMAAHPIDALRGVETMVSHTRTLPWWMQRGAGLGADMLGVLGGDTTVDELVGNLTQDPSTKAAEDNAYWQHTIDSMLKPMSDPWNNGRPWEAAGYATAALASLFIGEEGTLGKVADLTKSGRAVEGAGSVGAKAAIDTSKVESGTLKAWRSIDDAELGLADGKLASELPVEGTNRVARSQPPLSSRDEIAQAVRDAYEELKGDPRFSKLDPEGIIQNMRYLKEESYMQRLIEEACFRDKSLSYKDAFRQVAPKVKGLPSFVAPGTERFLGGAAAKGPEVRLLHVHDQIKAGKVKEVMQHELIHMAADPTLNRPDGMPLNEGITQWLTEGIHPPEEGVPLVDRPYANEVAQVRLLADQVGREAVLDAFHRGGVPELERLQTSPPVRPDIDLEAIYNNTFAPTETSPVWTDDPTAP